MSFSITINEVGLDVFCGLGGEGVDGGFCLHGLSNLVEVVFKPSNELGLSFPMSLNHFIISTN